MAAVETLADAELRACVRMVFEMCRHGLRFLAEKVGDRMLEPGGYGVVAVLIGVATTITTMIPYND